MASNSPSHCRTHPPRVPLQSRYLYNVTNITMNSYTQAEDLTVIGIQVKTFPLGIKEAFGSLMKTLGADRAYYGLSWMDDNDNIIYYAMTPERFAGEGKQHYYEALTIEKGEYRTETIHNWMSKTDGIKDVFHRLMGSDRPDKNLPCIEWYRSDEEILCMIRNS